MCRDQIDVEGGGGPACNSQGSSRHSFRTTCWCRESLDDRLLTNSFFRNLKGMFTMAVKNVDIERFENLLVIDPDIREMRSLSVEDVAVAVERGRFWQSGQTYLVKLWVPGEQLGGQRGDGIVRLSLGSTLHWTFRKIGTRVFLSCCLPQEKYLQVNLDFSPNMPVYAHHVWNLLSVVKEAWSVFFSMP